MKIAILEPLGITPEALDAFCAPLRAAGHTLTIYDRKPASAQEIAARAQDMDAVILANTPFPGEAIAACPHLGLIDVAFTGIDHIGMDVCREKGITVSNAANYSNQAVAELVIGLTVSLLRDIPGCDHLSRTQGTGKAGREIANRTVGIIGLGRIGRRVAALFTAFGAKVLAYDPAPTMDAPVPYVSLETLLRSSDIVTLHAPACESTRRMMGKAQFAQMKHSALFINCARGALVDAAALRDALNDGTIAGAAVDVFDREPPLPADEPLLHAKNILLTPHIAYASEESMLRRAEIVFANLSAYLAGAPVNVCP